MKKWFNSLPRIVKLILLLIPCCNWFFEITVRWSHFFEKKNFFSLLIDGYLVGFNSHEEPEAQGRLKWVGVSVGLETGNWTYKPKT